MEGQLKQDVLVVTCFDHFDDFESQNDILQFVAKIKQFFGEESVAVANSFVEVKKELHISAKSNVSFANIIAIYHPAYWVNICEIFADSNSHSTLAMFGRQVLPDWEFDNTDFLIIGKVLDDETFQTLRNLFGVNMQKDAPTGTYVLGNESTQFVYQLPDLTS